jgi:hypothetical protein
MKGLKLNFLKNVFLMFIILFGLWTSLHYTFCLWGPDTDQSFSSMLWYGVHHFGLSFIKSVSFTPDNWIFSLVPIFFLLFALFGVNPYIIVIVGWLIFAACAFLIGYIIKKTTKSTLAAFIGVTLSLFIGIYNYSASWFVFSNSHNTSMLWCLVDLILVINALSSSHKKSFLFIFYLSLILVVSFIAGFSDPWFNAAFNLPAIISLLIFGFRNSKYRKQSIFVIIPIALSWLISYSKFFGLLSFIPSSHFVFVSSLHQLKQNCYYYFVSLGSFFNIVQAFNINILLGFVFSILSLYIVITLFKKIVSSHNLIQLTIPEKIAVYFAIFSSLIITSAFLLSNLPNGLYSSRFLYNIFYFVILLFIIGFLKVSLRKIEKALIVTYLIFFILIGLAGNPICWIKTNIEIKDIGVNNLIKVLEENNLHFGYGDYLTSQVNSIAVLTKNKITMAGLTDSFAPHAQTSNFYFDLAKIPEENYYFMVIPNHKTPEWHLSVDESIRNAEFYFGKPVKIISIKNHTILIWNHPLNFADKGQIIFNTLFTSSQKFLSDVGNLSNLYPQYLESHGYLDKSFGGHQAGPANNWTQNSGWIGKWTCPDGKGECFGVGLLGDIDMLKPILDKYRSQALQIFFPYPKVYSPDSKETNGQLLMIFRAPNPNNTISEIPYTIDFKSNGNANIFEGNGFCSSENWGTWSCAKEVSLYFKLNDIPKTLYLKLNFHAFATLNHPQRFQFYLNGHLLKEEKYADSGDKQLILDISSIVQKENTFIIKVPDAATPKSLGISADTRDLGIGLVSILITK